MTRKNEKVNGQDDQYSTEEKLDRELLEVAKAVDHYCSSADHGVIDAVLTKMLNEASAKPSLLLKLLQREERLQRKLKALKMISKQPFFFSKKVEDK